jgi:hypothetical protein
MAQDRESRELLRSRRPAWIDEIIEGRTEWLLHDSQTNRLRVCYAESQREAIKKAIERNIIPRSTDDVRPREGGSRIGLMSAQEFENFMNSLQQG